MKIACTLMLFLQVGGIMSMATRDLAVLCFKTGGHDAVEMLRNGIEAYTSCRFEVMYGKKPRFLQAMLLPFDDDHPNLCRVIDNWKKHCVKQLADTVKTCFEPDRHEDIDTAYIMHIAMKQFTCENDTDDLKELESYPEGRSCESNESSAKNQCEKRFRSSALQEFVVDNVAILRMPERTFDAKGCSVWLRFQKCMFEAHAECSNQSRLNTVEKAQQYMINVLPC